jgi:hypothetical protein
VNGKAHTFQKDFTDFQSYRDFMGQYPEWYFGGLFETTQPEQFLAPANASGIELEKYEQRRKEKIAINKERQHKKNSLERVRNYLQKYLEESPEDMEAQTDLKKVEEELQTYT